MRKNFISVLLVLTMAICYIGNLTILASGYVYVEINETISVYAGSRTTKNIALRNDLDTEIKNVRISASSSSIYANVPASSGTIASIGAGELGRFSVILQADDDAPNESASVNLTVYYEVDGETETQSSYDSFNVYIIKSATVTPDPNRAPNLVLTAPTSVTTLKSGVSKTVDVVFKNSGNSTATNVLLLPEPSKNFSFTVGEDTNSESALTTGATMTMKLGITADKDIKAGTYEAIINYSFFDNNKKQQQGKATFHVKVENDETVINPNLVLKDFKISSDKIVGNDEFTVTATIENTSTVVAKNVQTIIGGLSATSIGMTNASTNSYFDSIPAKSSKTITYRLKAYEKIKTGSYPVKFSLSYKDGEAKDYSNEYNYYIWVTSKDDATGSNANRAVLSVSKVGVGSKSFDTGEKFPISFNIINDGKLEARNVFITAECPEGIVPNSVNKQQILSILPGENKPVSFIFSPTAASKTQGYTIGFTVTYENGVLEDSSEGVDIKEKDTFTQYVGVNVVNTKVDIEAKRLEDKEREKEAKAEEKERLAEEKERLAEEREREKEEAEKNKSIPKIIVSKYSVDPIIVQAGQEFDLYMTFQNTHKTKSVENVKALLTVPLNSEGNKTANVFSPVDASNTFYIDSIEPKAESEQHIRMFTIPNAAAQNYILVIDFEYEDAEGNQIKQQSEVGVNVKQNTKLELGDIVMPTNANVGDPLYVEFSVQNSGKVTLNNLKVKLSGEGFDTMGAEMIFGNFASGNHDTFYAQFTPTMPGEQTIKVLVSYDDDTGEHFETVNEYPMQVNEAMIMEGEMMGPDGEMIGPDGVILGPDGMPMEGDSEGVLGFISTNWIWFTSGGIVIIAAIAGIVVFVRIKRRKGFDIDA